MLEDYNAWRTDGEKDKSSQTGRERIVRIYRVRVNMVQESPPKEIKQKYYMTNFDNERQAIPHGKGVGIHSRVCR